MREVRRKTGVECRWLDIRSLRESVLHAHGGTVSPLTRRGPVSAGDTCPVTQAFSLCNNAASSVWATVLVTEAGYPWGCGVMRSRFSLARRTVLVIAILAGSLFVLASSAASAASAVDLQAPASVSNQSGRLDTASLYDLGSHTSALYAFLSDGAKYVQTTAWSGALAWSRAKLCVGDAMGLVRSTW